MKRKVFYRLLIGLAIVLLLMQFVFNQKEKVEQLSSFESQIVNTTQEEDRYTTYLQNYSADSFNVESNYVINTSEMTYSENVNLLDESNSFGIGSDSLEVNRNDWVEFDIDILEEGLYIIDLLYYYQADELLAPKLGVLIDNLYPFYESRQLSLPINWVPSGLSVDQNNQTIISFQTDRYNNDIQPISNIERTWQHNGLYDASYYYVEPLQFYLDEGTHNIKLIMNNDGLIINQVNIYAKDKVNDYQTYASLYSDKTKYDDLIELEAEYYTSKSDPSIKLYSDTRVASTPFSLSENRLNAVDAYTWDEAGRSATWTINAPQEGLYQISFKYIQYRLTNLATYREIKVNGEVPFTELSAFAFPYSQDWANITLGDEEPYWIYLEEGDNTLTLTSTVDPYRPVIETIESILNSITSLTIEIQKLTGGNTDSYRDWDLVDYIPNLEETLLQWADWLEQGYRYCHYINDRTNPAGSLVNLEIAFNQLRVLAENTNDLPNRMDMLSEGTSSVSKYLGDLILSLTEQSLGLEKIYLVGEDFEIPSPTAGFFKTIWVGIKDFFYSFRKDEEIVTDESKTIEVWVNRPRANVDLMQQYIDQVFTPQTGIYVNLSLMPNANKLILSNAANIEPDVAMGVTSQTPFNFAIRNAAVDLRKFEGYSDVVANFAPGSMISYVYEDGVYGFPETQDFYITVYRTDIMSQINLTIPDTWDEVINMLPALRRMGMNYYHPLGSSNSYKSFNLTSTFFEQFNASIYTDNGIYSNIDSDEAIEAIDLMTELFTVHDLPEGTANFYNHFRYGNLPIGIANSQTYLQLLIAAPEIKGNWDIALYPGVEESSGDINRYAAATTTGTMIFSSSDKQELAFEFLEWWHSTEIQIRFGNDIQKMFGKEYMWFSSNLEALATLPIDTEHKEIILEQLTYVTAAPNTPGGYYLEREISNVWNRVVLSDDNLRDAIDDAKISADRELWRKYLEFGYVDELDILKDYQIPTINNIDYWLQESGDDDE
ncbi:extracellular solute-binding protein [Candidatus Izemoplasma sp. B36]|uniref:extracellular solute-binding protein n=1 Tax=Candidatus Izemoplasma sp. B36 TaxID=3242468 RepID=UPI0035592517